MKRKEVVVAVHRLNKHTKNTTVKACVGVAEEVEVSESKFFSTL